jgi:hypothetical protein
LVFGISSFAIKILGGQKFLFSELLHFFKVLDFIGQSCRVWAEPKEKRMYLAPPYKNFLIGWKALI